MNNLENNLENLSKMLKKRNNPDFKNDLRNQLLKKANAMNEAASRESKVASREKRQWSFSMPTFARKAWAPAVAGVLIFALFFYALTPGGGTLPLQLVDVAAAKDYYVLTPVSEDSSGVDSESEFVLTSKGEINADEVVEAITIEPAASFTIDQVSSNEVKIVPLESLDLGEVYSVSLNASELKDAPYQTEYSWAYQISDGFRVASTLPADQSTNVLINTGVEVVFNTRDVEVADFENYFSIEPYVDGFFDKSEKTLVFAPYEELDEMSLYTVTVSAGLPLDDGEKTLENDFVFQFETGTTSRSSGTLRSREAIYDIEAGARSFVPVYYYGWGDEEMQTADIEIYKFASSDDFADALMIRDSIVPAWSSWQGRNYSSDVSGLELVMSVEGAEVVDDYQRYNDAIEIPDTLDRGHYVIKFSKDTASGEAFIQATDVSTYVSLAENSTFVWSNDIKTGEPMSGYSVSDIDDNDSVKLDSNGAGVLDTSDSPIIKLEGDDFDYYYYTSLNDWNYDLYQNWSFLETERWTYHPDDTIYFWGYLEGRDEKINGDAKVVITNYSWGTYQEILDRGAVFYEQDLYLVDGDVFDGSIEIEKMPQGSYGLLIVQDDKVLTVETFYVYDFVKPAYNVSTQVDEDRLMPGDTVNLEIDANFFEGTPVSNLELNVTAPTNFGDDAKVYTDGNGEATATFTASSDPCKNDWCNLFQSQYFVTSPSNSEEADISNRARVTVANSDVGSPDVEFDENGFSLTTYNLDIDKIRALETGLSETYDVYGDVAPGTRVDVEIEMQNMTKEEKGTYYDYITKTVKTTYSYNFDDVVIFSETLYTDENGELNYDFGLDTEKRHTLRLTIYGSSEEMSYKDTDYYSPGADYYMYNADYDYLNLTGIDYDGYDVGDAVDLEIDYIFNTEEISEEDLTFLFLESHLGISDYHISDTPEYSFKFSDEKMPNVYYSPVMFDGQYYAAGSTQSINYKEELSEIDVTVTSDKEEYAPSDDITISFDAGVESDVNVYLVDEAYYALYAEVITNPVNEIYSGISSGIHDTYISFQRPTQQPGGKGGCFIAGTKIWMADGTFKNIEDIELGDVIATRESAFNGMIVDGEVVDLQEHYVGDYILVNGDLGVTGEHVLLVNGQWNVASEIELGDYLLNSDGEDVLVTSLESVNEPVWVYNFEVEKYHTYFANGIYVHNDKGGTMRDDFEDTAYFDVVKTDSSGKGSVTFELPDNITSWRVVVSAIGRNRTAGMTTMNVDVTKPIFVVPVINTSYLTGDAPIIPIRAYGDYLEAGDALDMGVYADSFDYDQEASGEAYEVTKFDLGALPEGEHQIVSWAEIDNEGDAIGITTEVVDSYLTSNNSWEDLATEGLNVEGSSEKRTTLYFMNDEVGYIYRHLLAYANNNPDRADEDATKVAAIEVLNEYFDLDYSSHEFDYKLYQNDDGGIGVISYDDSRIDLTVLLAGLDASLWSQSELSDYFQDIVDGEEYSLTETVQAIYGLASIGEPALNDLNYLIQNYGFSTEDKLYAALAYLEYGDKSSATELYLELSENYKDILKDASWATMFASIAAQIGSEDHRDIWEDAIDIESDDLVVLERMLYIKSVVDLGANAEVSFKVNGDKVTLKGTEYHKMSILPSELGDIEFSDVMGDVKVISYYSDPLDLDELDANSQISISRSYSVDGVETDTFEEGQLVKVELTMSIPTSLSGSYTVTDYLPSGLKPSTSVSSSTDNIEMTEGYKRPWRSTGQQTSFFTYRSKYANSTTTSFYYYARVINGGTFKAEPAVLQKIKDPEVINVSDPEIITITSL